MTTEQERQRVMYEEARAIQRAVTDALDYLIGPGRPEPKVEQAVTRLRDIRDSARAIEESSR